MTLTYGRWAAVTLAWKPRVSFSTSPTGSPATGTTTRRVDWAGVASARRFAAVWDWVPERSEALPA